MGLLDDIKNRLTQKAPAVPLRVPDQQAAQQQIATAMTGKATTAPTTRASAIGQQVAAGQVAEQARQQQTSHNHPKSETLEYHDY